eukprot:CAMPEP_0196594304 /NCGR_PEP_ID=MMETSP1081-20130531/77947_1 /TAXON_ID=36882 /ORGANISM="Pyramimonas amylifera, Strain CCMP720" /LENGTH=528 /DNA_ID=CAMNT_0041918529 /DNA_START=89 /DNA_END=1675 /DNA_ORIENTATION=-
MESSDKEYNSNSEKQSLSQVMTKAVNQNLFDSLNEQPKSSTFSGTRNLTGGDQSNECFRSQTRGATWPCKKKEKYRRKSANDFDDKSHTPTIPSYNQIKRWKFSPQAPTGFSPQDAFSLLQNVFPAEALEELQWDLGTEISQSHPSVSVFFSDIVGFTAWSSKVPASTVIGCLSSYFQIMDDLAERRGVYKVETIGDCWMAVCGAPHPNSSHAQVMASFALEVLRTIDDLQLIFEDRSISIRVGLHCGPVVSGIVRADRPRWQLFGDTVNMASRMESSGIPGNVQISEDMFMALEASAVRFRAISRRIMKVKGKGDQQTYILQAMSSEKDPEPMDRLTVFNPPEYAHRFMPKKASSRGHFSVGSFKSSYNLSDARSSSSAPNMHGGSDGVLKNVAEDPSKHTPAVLLVDRMLSVCMQYRRVIQGTGLQVFTAHDRRKGFELMKQQAFLAVFLEDRSPEMPEDDSMLNFREWEKKNRVQKQYIVALHGKLELSKEENNHLYAQGFDAIESKMNNKATILNVCGFPLIDT